MTAAGVAAHKEEHHAFLALRCGLQQQKHFSSCYVSLNSEQTSWFVSDR
jgi:hypothetical protein